LAFAALCGALLFCLSSAAYAAEAPYGGTAAAVPGTVQAENYDTGGSGVAYNVTSTNGSDNGYRSDGVDLEVTTDTGGGLNLGWSAAGQWFKYTVNVATAGKYTVTFRLAAESAIADGLHISNSSGTNLSGSVAVPNTGGWQTWTSVTASVTLPAGQQTLTVNQDAAGWNLNYLSFAAASSSEGPYPGPAAAAIPGTVMAENYDTGGQGVGYSVTSTNGSANSYRSNGVDLEAATSPATGNDLGWSAAEQWFRYTVNLATAGSYTVSILVASPTAIADAFHLSNSSGTNLSGSVAVPATGGYQTWVTVMATVTLPAGTQTLTLSEDAGGWNIDSLKFATSVGGCTTKPSAPTGLAASGTTSTTTNLNWTPDTAPANCSISNYTVLKGGVSIGTATGTSFAVTGLTASTNYSFTVEATDAAGASAASSAVSVTTLASTGEAPYPGPAAAAVPGTVLAENYDTGGQGVAYNVTSTNGSATSYRSQGVDLEAATSPATGNDLGWSASGQWFRYTVNVAAAGQYQVAFLVASPTAVADAFHLSNSSGTNLTGSVAVPATGGYQTWVTVTTNITLPAGQQTLTLNDDAAGWNIDQMVFASGSTGSSPDARANAMLAQMTQAEKLQLIQGSGGSRGAAGYVPGIPSLGIPALYLADGSVGVGNGVGPATALPASLASAASWDTSEAYKYGTIIGSELADYGINVNLGGNINLIGREPRDGRSFETKGEDPILAGKIAAQHLMAIQAQHVMADIKHYAFNDQETDRTTANAVISDQGGRESDLLAFEIGIKDSNVQSVMCGYNLTNGVYDCENNYLLTQVLKNDWGFPGFVMSDWGATHSTVNAALNGLDQEQPDGSYFSQLGTAISNNQVPESQLNDMVERILRAMYEVGIFDYPLQIKAIPAAADAAVAQDIEEKGAVLLKNANNQLPLSTASKQSIAIIGFNSNTAVLSGGGSAQVQPIGGGLSGPGSGVWDRSSPMNAIQALAPSATLKYADGSNSAAAASLAASSQVAIVFVNQWASEGMDEPSLNLTDFTSGSSINQDALVEAVAAANPHTIVVVETGNPIVMPWLSQVSAVLEAWYPGQSGGPAIADLLFGVTNPSGKLPITFPASVSQLPRPTIPSGGGTVDVNMTEGFNVGYKWYDVKGYTPLFYFGYGLSYTTFSITNAALVNNLSSTSNPNFQVTFNLANTGAVAGAEVAQVYLGLPASLNEPPRRLVGWQKVLLQPNSSQAVTIEVNQNDSSHPMSYWNTSTGSWTVAPGTYTVYLGNSEAAASLKTVGTITVP
jgi:beta-glucosidase